MRGRLVADLELGEHEAHGAELGRQIGEALEHAVEADGQIGDEVDDALARARELVVGVALDFFGVEIELQAISVTREP